jgi:hypothetical protein
LREGAAFAVAGQPHRDGPATLTDADGVTVTDREHLSLEGLGRSCPRQESSQHQQQGQPAQCHRWSLHACHFYALSASICSCPLVFYCSGNTCVSSPSNDREAIQKTGNSCPLGWFSAGSYCVKSR